MSALQLIEVKSPVEWVMRNKTDSGQPYEITFLLNKDARKVKLQSDSFKFTVEKFFRCLCSTGCSSWHGYSRLVSWFYCV